MRDDGRRFLVDGAHCEGDIVFASFASEPNEDDIAIVRDFRTATRTLVDGLRSGEDPRARAQLKGLMAVLIVSRM